MNAENIINKIPFNGKGSNLIDYFYIIGWEDVYIEEVIIPDIPQQMTYEPSIISSICSEYADKGIDENDLINVVFPNKGLISDSNYVKDTITNVIFTMTTEDNKSSLCGYARLFYEKYTMNNQKKNMIYIPKAVVLMSKFPYFNTFNFICCSIVSYMQKEYDNNYLSSELVLFTIVNYSPAPLYSDEILDLFPNRDNNDLSNLISLKQLSGYPLVDFNLSKIFSFLPMNLVIELFIYSLLEIDMIFFSINIEMLNIIMYIIRILTYPLINHKDAIYSVSKQTFQKMKLYKNNTAYLGVNTIYDESLLFSSIFKSYVIINLDSQKIIHKGNKNDEFVMQRELIGKYIQKCIKGKAEKSLLIQRLINRLIETISFVIIDGFWINFNSKSVNFFEINNDIRQSNRRIQTGFYEFIIGFLQNIYKDLKISFNKKNNDNEKILSKAICNNQLYSIEHDTNESFNDKEEELIMLFFKTTQKFTSFFTDFLYLFKADNNNKIPLLFTEEFLKIDLYNSSQTSNPDSNNYSLNQVYFDTIDTFYSINKSNKQDSIEVSFSLFYNQIHSLIKNDFLSLKKTSNNNFIKLNKKRLRKLMYIMINRSNIIDSMVIFNNHANKSNSNNPLSIEIILSIEQSLLSHHLIHTDNLLLSSILSIFLISNTKLPFLTSLYHFNHLTFQLNERNYFFRKSLYMVLQSLYSLTQSDTFDANDSTLTEKIKIYYNLVLTRIKNNQMIPNREISWHLSYFNAQSFINRETKYTIKDNESDMNEMKFQYSIVNQFNNKFNSIIAYEAIHSTLTSCNLTSKGESMKFIFSIKDSNNLTLLNEPKFYDVYSVIKLKEECQQYYQAFITNDEDSLFLTPTAYENLLSNLLCYTQTSQDLKFFTQYFIQLYMKTIIVNN